MQGALLLTNILCPEGHAITDKKENGNVCIYNIITQNQYAFPISFSNLFVGRRDWGHNLCNISFCYLFLLHGGPEQGMNKAVLSSKCIHSFNEFLKIMELLLGNGEIIHSQRPMQILTAEVAPAMGVSLWNPLQ